jgi:outer membrane protein OmpA-like peptidoglycan-associated protein
LGVGAITYSVTNGTATGCAVNGTGPYTLSASSAGTCNVYASIAGDINYSAATSTDVAVTFSVTATAPGAPGSLSGTAGDAQVALAWSAGSNGGSSITGYEVEYSSNAGTTWNVATINTGSTATNYTVSGLTNGTSYEFEVAAINGVGTGPFATSSGYVPAAALSNQVITLTSSSATTTLDQSPYTITQASTNDPGATLVYTKSDTSSPTCTITGAKISFTTSGTCVVDVNAAADTLYTAAAQQVFTLTVNAARTAPGAPNSLSGTPGDSQVALTWNAGSNGGSSITGYEVKYSSNGGVTWNVATANTGSTATSYTVSGLINGTAYQFEVAAINTVGTGTFATSSAYVPVGAPTVPGAPSSLSGLPGDSQVALTWGTGSNGGRLITGYEVEYSSDGVTWNVAVANTGSTTTSYTVTGLANGTPYQFEVAAINTVGTGALAASSGYTPFAAITQSSLASGSVTSVATPTFYSQVTATGGVGSFAYGETSGDTGLSITSTGVISTTGVLAEGIYTISGTITDILGNRGNFTFTLVVQAAVPSNAMPVFTSSYLPSYTVGVGGTATFTATGTPTPDIVEVSPLPNGVTFDTSSDVLTVGASALAGTYTLTFVATSGTASSTQISVLVIASYGQPTDVVATVGTSPDTVSLTWVAPDLSMTPGVSVTNYTITPEDLTDGTVGSAILGVDPTATSYSVSGLNGGDTYTFMVTANRSTSKSGSATSNYVLPVAAAPVASTIMTGAVSNSQSTTSSATIGTVGASGSITATATGQGAISIAVYAGNPAGAAFVVPSGTTTTAYDVAVSPGSQFQTINFQVCDDPSGQVYWFNSLTQQTIPVSPAPIAVPGSNNCVSVNLSPTSTPTSSGSELYGSIFFIKRTAPVVVIPATISFLTQPPALSVVGNTYTVVANSKAVFTTTSSACTVLGDTVTFVAAGTCTILATAVPGTNDTAAPGTQTINVVAPGAIDFTSLPPSNSVVGGRYTATATSTAGTVLFSTSSNACAVSGDTVIFIDAGVCTVAASVLSSLGYVAATASFSFAITALAVDAPTAVTAVAGDASATVSWSSPPNATSFTFVAYTVTASPGGATCSASSATNCIVTGLTNGTDYTFSVVAISSGPASTSAASASSPRATPTAVTVTTRLTLSHFAAKSSKITASMKARLVTLAASLVSHGVSSVTLSGYTDNVGSAAADRSLGLKRANAIAAFLRQQLKRDGSATAVAFHVTTLGRTNPLSSNATKAGRSENNRVTVVATS